MKKSLLALAALGLFAGAASAQSSVTLFGIVDAGLARITAKTSGGDKTVTGMTNSGYNSSRLGFRGVEDLGGGLRAAFHIEGQLTNDDGNAAGFNFQRKSTVALIGGFGEIRLGRDYTPTFYNLTQYDEFGTNGIGQAMTPGMLANVAAPTTTNTTVANQTNSVRANNSVSYFLPANLGGFNGQFMYAFGEGVAGVRTHNYAGMRLGYAAGPISVHGAIGRTEGGNANTNIDSLDIKYANFGASFDLGVVKPMVVLAQEKASSGLKARAAEVSVSVPFGQASFRAAYSKYKQSGAVPAGTTAAAIAAANAFNSSDWDKIAVGGLYNLSKRTALYGTIARVDNDGAGIRIVSNNGLNIFSNLQAGVTLTGGKTSTGVEVGIRHSF